jgi:ribosomal protein S18 acetylase RimI-like enzyme
MVRPAAHDSRLIHVRPRDDSKLPEIDELRWWLDTIAAENPAATTIRSAALFPRAAERFEAAGFEVADRLALLRADLLSETFVHTARLREPRGDGTTRAMRRRHFTAAAVVDRAAFGPAWGHDASELVEVCRATPFHAARHRLFPPRRVATRPGRATVGFAIAGASSEHGYLQRLAVDPGAQRRGHGRALTLDALRWMLRRQLPDCLVNTSVDNEAALALYRSIGFTPMPDQLTVLHFDVRAVR